MITITLASDEISAGLARLAAGLSNMSPVMNEIGDYLLGSTEERFKTGKGPDGASWAARSFTTLQIYARRKPPQTPGAYPLTLTGTMSNTLHMAYGADFAEVGSGAIQAAVMQFGAAKGSLGAYWFTSASGKAVEGSSPWGNIPARPFLGLSAEDETNITDIILKWMDRVTEG